MFHFSVLVSQLENQFSFHKELRSYSSQPRPLARRVPNKSPAPSVGAIYSESSAVIACFSPLKKKKKQQKKRWNWVHNKACSAACDTGVHEKKNKNTKRNRRESRTERSSSTWERSRTVLHHGLHSSRSPVERGQPPRQPWDLRSHLYHIMCCLKNSGTLS